MKRLKWLVLAAFMVTLSGLSWFGIAQAQSMTTRVAKNKVIDGSVYSAGRDIRIDGTVNGDLHCFGQEVYITGTVKGDVLCAGQILKITGTVEGSVRAAGQEVVLAGHIGHGASIAADIVTVQKDAHIVQDATLAGSTVRISGEVGRDVTATAAALNVEGAVGRTLMYSGSRIDVSKGASVLGGITYQSDRSITIDDQATIKGEVERKKAEDTSSGFNWMFALGVFLAMLLFALAIVLLWPQAVHATSDIAVRSLGKTMLVGFMAAILVPIAIVLLALSVVGIPLAFLAMLIGLLVAMLSGPVAAYYLGSMILSKSKNPVLIMLLGASILLVVYALPLPVITFFAMLFSYLIGTGAILIKIRRSIPKPTYRVE